VAFSCDGGRVVTASGDRTAKVWDAATGKLLVTLQGRHSRPVRGAAFSPDGQRIVTASGDQSAIVWEVATGRDLFTLQGHSAPVIRALFSPDGRRIVTASADATAKIWEADGGSYVRTLQGHDSGIFGLAFSPDGGRIATGSADQTVRVWDATSGRTLLTLTGLSGIVASVAFSPDGGRIAAASTAGPWTTPATATLWDARSGKLLRTFKGHSAEVDSVAFSPDGRRLLTGSGDETARVWDAATGEELLTLKCHNWAAFSPDGRRIVTACADWTAKVWEAATPSQLTAWQADENEASRRLDALAREQQAVINRARAASANDPGAIKQWLILGPIGFNGHCGSVGVNQEQLAGEAHLRPSAGERIHVGESDLAWRPLQLHDYFIDFHPLFLAGPNWSVTYAVCYIESESDQTGLTIKVSSEDQSKIYLNGNEIYRCERARQYLPDQDEVSGVELKRGLNTLVFKVANEEDTPQASLRFTDAAGRPLKGIRTTLTPR
jgi:hypothetical protein